MSFGDLDACRALLSDPLLALRASWMTTCSCVCVMRVQMDVEPGFFEQADAAQVCHQDEMMLMPGGPAPSCVVVCDDRAYTPSSRPVLWPTPRYAVTGACAGARQRVGLSRHPPGRSAV
jgi:hypothetical protein